MRAYRSGFTLVELSIVLVVIGLLVGGIIGGQSLIRSAQLRAILTEKGKYVAAVSSFRDKYYALPGDMIDAYRFWSWQCGTDTNDPSDGCNGNGNNIIENDQGEGLKAWEHLSRAGMIEGAYTGMGAGNCGNCVGPDNIPKSKFPEGAWNIGNFTCQGCGSGTPDVSGSGSGVNLMLTIGTPGHTFWVYELQGLSNDEAWSIDAKADDGRSLSGNVRGYALSSDCTDDGEDYYSLSDHAGDTGKCALTFVLN